MINEKALKCLLLTRKTNPDNKTFLYFFLIQKLNNQKKIEIKKNVKSNK